jgi:hypothetical protein
VQNRPLLVIAGNDAIESNDTSPVAFVAGIAGDVRMPAVFSAALASGGAAPPWVKMAAVSAPMAVRGRTLYFSWQVIPSIASFRGGYAGGGEERI